MELKTFISVNNQIDMLHYYGNAPEGSFLKNVHRHLFKVKTTVQVFHYDREIEFFTLQKYIQGWLDRFKFVNDGTDFSCELLASYLYSELQAKYGTPINPDRVVRAWEIEVSEDGENSATIKYS